VHLAIGLSVPPKLVVCEALCQTWGERATATSKRRVRLAIGLSLPKKIVVCEALCQTWGERATATATVTATQAS
jgi:hypothetical protein